MNHSLTNGGGDHLPASDNDPNLNRPRKARVTKSSERPDVLNKQMSVARRSGKVRTTQELVQNLGMSGVGQAAPKLNQSVNNLVPDENKMELMNRFFHSQESGGREGHELSLEGEISRPSTATGATTTVSSYSATPGVSRAPSPSLATSVDDVLASLPPIDAKAVWAEWEANASDDEEDVEGLIPIFKQEIEITKTLVNDLNDGQLEYLGGISDYQGNFKEWHELASRETKDGDLLHILPYSVID